MALTITYPNRVTPAYNPILIEAISDVTRDFTIGIAKGFDTVSSANGFCRLDFLFDHNLQSGDYILITSAPGAEQVEGVALVTSIIDSDSLVINKPFTTGLSALGEAFKYLNNYNAYVKIYVYTEDAPTTPKFVGDKTLKAKFEGGFCKFVIDMASIVRGFNWDAYAPNEVLKWDLIPSGSTHFVNKKSFVHWGVEISEAFDNPAGGTPQYEQDIEA